MAYVIIPPPSIETMLFDFADWMAQHAGAKVSVKIEYRDGRHQTQETDHRGPMQSPKVGAGDTPPHGKNPVCPHCGGRMNDSRDAARYRWLKRQPWVKTAGIHAWADALDSAIDAARHDAPDVMPNDLAKPPGAALCDRSA